MEAERAWAYSQDLVSQSLQPANTENAHTLRHSATGRFRRSVNWSTQLLSHCQVLFASSRLSAESLLETTIYTLILNGRFLRYREDFEDALIQLSVARHLLDELAAAATTSRDQALAVLFADEIGPEIRYCAHELGREKSYDIDGIVSELSSKHKNALVEGCVSLLSRFKAEEEPLKYVEGKKKLATLIWEGEPVPVRNPELVDVFLKVQEAEKKLDVYDERKVKAGGSKKSVAAYDAILLALSDAEDVARRLKEAQQVKPAMRIFAFGGISHSFYSQQDRLRLQAAEHAICTSFTHTPYFNYYRGAFNVTLGLSKRCWLPHLVPQKSSLNLSRSMPECILLL